MHELSLVSQLVELAEDSARQAGATRVTAVRLRVGQLSGVSEDALRFAYDIATVNTRLEGSRLEVETVPVKVYCSRCQQVRELTSIQHFRCPVCKFPAAEVRAGRELEIDSLEVE